MKRLLLAAVFLIQVPAAVPELKLAKMQLSKTRMDLAEQKFINAMNEADKAKADYNKYQADLNAQIDDVYTELKLKREEYDINIGTGAITKKQPQ